MASAVELCAGEISLSNDSTRPIGGPPRTPDSSPRTHAPSQPLDAITAFAVPNPNGTSQHHRFFRVWLSSESLRRTNHPGCFGLATARAIAESLMGVTIVTERCAEVDHTVARSPSWGGSP